MPAVGATQAKEPKPGTSVPGPASLPRRPRLQSAGVPTGPIPEADGGAGQLLAGDLGGGAQRHPLLPSPRASA